MANYGNEINKATSSTSVGVGSLEAPASSMRRVDLYEVIAGSDAGTPTDNGLRFEVNRSTTAATGTAVTPEPLDPADAACVALLKSNNTVQGTNTAGKIPLSWAMNSRTTFRWSAAPGSEIVVPAVASNGLSFNTPVANGTPSIAMSVLFRE
jgi:hypothetical protein